MLPVPLRRRRNSHISALPAALAAGFLAGLAFVTSAVAQSRSAPERFVALLADGSRAKGPAMQAWPLSGASFRLEGKELFDAANPVRLLRDQTADVQREPPLVILANGDVVNGSPVGLVEAVGGPRLKVQLETPLMPVSGTHVLVRPNRIRRIVGTANTNLAEPPEGTVLLTDGRKLVARSIRWREYGLAILTEAGVVEASYESVADAVFPGVDVVSAVLDDNLFAGGTSPGAISRFTLTSGATLTASRVSRELERVRSGRSRTAPQVYYYMQPAWSSHAIAVPEQEIAWCSYRSADEAPLSLLPAQTQANRRLLGQAEPWRRNETAAGESLLAGGGRESDLGIATHSYSELAFILPSGTKTLSLTVALDRAVGEGGCVRCRIFADGMDGKELWESYILRGSDGAKETGELDVEGVKHVILVTEYAHEDRPEGADPLDICDDVLWLTPLVRLDWTPQAGSDLARAALDGLGGWDAGGEGWQETRLATQWNEFGKCWDPVLVVSKEAELILTRKVRISEANDVVQLLAAAPKNLEEHLIHLRVDDEAIGWTTSTDRARMRELYAAARPTRRDPFQDRRGFRNQQPEVREPSDTLAYWWDLQEWRGREVTLELTIRGSEERNQIAWRGLSHRSAVLSPPKGQKWVAPDVSLTSINPRSLSPIKERGGPAKDSLPLSRTRTPIKFLGQEYSGGYAMIRSSQVTFDLKPEYKLFTALVGCCEGESGRARILIDGHVVWERPSLSALDQAIPAVVPIPPGSRLLTLETGPEQRTLGITGFARAGFVK
ncbi:MAG: NPCBM/NEW2 domain-containing protein [Pirellulaceae bacterium]|nr:NPCBM/NEW2 domain-containing protein [Pirellulaceae bacterium]